MFNNGPPKHAESAIIGNPILAIVKFEMKSPNELPMAKIVIPNIASERSKSSAKNLMIEINSAAIVEIQETDIPNPSNAQHILKILDESSLPFSTAALVTNDKHKNVADMIEGNKINLILNPSFEKFKKVVTNGAKMHCKTSNLRPFSLIVKSSSTTGTVSLNITTNGKQIILKNLSKKDLDLKFFKVGNRVNKKLDSPLKSFVFSKTSFNLFFKIS